MLTLDILGYCKQLGKWIIHLILGCVCCYSCWLCSEEGKFEVIFLYLFLVCWGLLSPFFLSFFFALHLVTWMLPVGPGGSNQEQIQAHTQLFIDNYFCYSPWVANGVINSCQHFSYCFGKAWDILHRTISDSVCWEGRGVFLRAFSGPHHFNLWCYYQSKPSEVAVSFGWVVGFRSSCNRACQFVIWIEVLLFLYLIVALSLWCYTSITKGYPMLSCVQKLTAILYLVMCWMSWFIAPASRT